MSGEPLLKPLTDKRLLLDARLLHVDGIARIGATEVEVVGGLGDHDGDKRVRERLTDATRMPRIEQTVREDDVRALLDALDAAPTDVRPRRVQGNSKLSLNGAMTEEKEKERVVVVVPGWGRRKGRGLKKRERTLHC